MRLVLENHHRFPCVRLVSSVGQHAFVGYDNEGRSGTFNPSVHVGFVRRYHGRIQHYVTRKFLLPHISWRLAYRFRRFGLGRLHTWQCTVLYRFARVWNKRKPA